MPEGHSDGALEGSGCSVGLQLLGVQGLRGDCEGPEGQTQGTWSFSEGTREPGMSLGQGGSVITCVLWTDPSGSHPGG